MFTTSRMNKATEGRILLVGEGNFSLSSSLVENRTVSGPQLTASCIDTFNAVQQAHRLAASNIEFLEKAGGTVLFEVDATDLHNHPDIKFFEYERVIFNFPLSDRHNIKKNRALLSDFFSSVKNILNPESGQVMVTLCKGQGGTPADQPMRSWHDSWQAVSMAANAGFILTDIQPFEATKFSRYESVGFRFQDKGFNTDGALIHIFEMAKSATIPEVALSKRFIRQGTDDYIVPAYIRRKLDRLCLLGRENHPLHTLHDHFVSCLRKLQPDICILDPNDPSLPRVLSGYKSSLNCRSGGNYIASMETQNQAETVETEVETVQTQNEVETMETDDTVAKGGVDDKEGGRTEEANLSGGKLSETSRGGTQASETAQGDARKPSTPISKEMKDLQNMEKAAAATASLDAGDRSCSKKSEETSPEESISKDGLSPDRMFAHGVQREAAVGGLALVGNAEKKPMGVKRLNVQNVLPSDVSVFVVHRRSDNQPGAMSEKPQLEGASCDSSVAAEDSSVAQFETSSADQQSPTPSLFHLRSSLLENLPDLRSFMKVKSKRSAVTSGLVFNKCPITPVSLAVSHQMIFLSDVTGACSKDKLVSHLRSALGEVIGDQSTAQIKVEGCESLYTVGDKGRIYIASDLVLENNERKSVLGKVFLYADKKTVTEEVKNDDEEEQKEGEVDLESFSHVGVILYLDSIILNALRLPDIRLVWSEDDRFLKQFSTNNSNGDAEARGKSNDQSSPLSSFSSFRPFSIYPVRFVHDVSFWENSGRVFEETEFLDVVREVADDVVTSVTLVDRFENTEQGITSRCYRLVFQSHDRALSYIASWKLQSVIRLQVAQKLGVQLR